MWGARNQTDPDCYRSSSPLKHSGKTHFDQCIFYTTQVCVFADESLPKWKDDGGVPVQSSLSSTSLFCQPHTENQTKTEMEWMDTPPHLFLTLSPSLSLPLTAQSSNLIPIFSPALLSPPFSCLHLSRSLYLHRSPVSPSLFLSLCQFVIGPLLASG